jgi:hypothetical protein
MIKRNIYYLLIAGQPSLLVISNVGAQHAICNMRVRGIVAPLPPVRWGINARTSRIWKFRILSMQCVRDYWHGRKARSDKRSKPNKGVLIYVGKVSVGRRHKSLKQSRIAVRWGINNLELLLICDKALIVNMMSDVPTTERTISKMSKLKLWVGIRSAFDITPWRWPHMRSVMLWNQSCVDTITKGNSWRQNGILFRDKLSSKAYWSSR